MKRRGTIVIDTFGEFHCGLADRLIVNWECEITQLSEALDTRGFMIDQLEDCKDLQRSKENRLVL